MNAKQKNEKKNGDLAEETKTNDDTSNVVMIVRRNRQ